MPETTTINPLRALNEEFRQTEREIMLGGGPKAIDRQHAKDRLTARERIERLVDDIDGFVEFGLWSAYGMYTEHGGAPGAGVVTGVGTVEGRACMIIANDATVKAGAFFPMTCKKIIRAQMIAEMARLPLLYLVDSAGVFLPLQEDVFPDTDDFGRIFRNNAVISAKGIPQIAAIMGYCVAGGGYLPVLCDTLLMTEGSGLYLAGPALVKAAIGQTVTDEELGSAEMHATISGTIDFHEPDDESCLMRLRSLVSKLRAVPAHKQWMEITGVTEREGGHAYEVFTDKQGAQYDMREIIKCAVDAGTFDEYREGFGQTVLCGYAKIGGEPCGIVANQKEMQKPASGGIQLGGVIYHDSADKAARFIMDCNQKKLPIVFMHDTTGFMVGRESEQAGIIRAGAKMVNAMSNTITPKIVLIIGGSYGAGNYAMCGRAFDPFLTLAWPGSKCSVMGAAQATGVLAMIEERSRTRKGEEIDEATHKEILDAVAASYTEQQDIRYGAARGWVDRIIQPHETRRELALALKMARDWDYEARGGFRTGVLQT
ncbi:acyl-CoA carboxylase subunit beta [Planctomycetaceae bacterium AH-315-I19]|nr:acyl-CoA carboxylase subunit beta [Planctomycetaceae bacterium AH-315-I19]